MADIDLCLSCEYGWPIGDREGALFGFCKECESSGRAELYLAILAVQDDDKEDALRLIREAKRKGLLGLLDREDP